MIGGTLFAPAHPTCNDNRYDFFVVSKAFAFAVVGTQRVGGVPMKPHRPARLLLRGDARRCAVRKIVRPARVSANLHFGPVLATPTYASVTVAAGSICERPLNQPLQNEEATMNTAMTDWYQAARTEFSDIAGVDLKFAPM